MKDCLGNDVKVGDKILVAESIQDYAEMKVKYVLEIQTKNNYLGQGFHLARVSENPYDTHYSDAIYLLERV
ncbi:hypothetical protein Barba19A_gp095 [Rheinheimera phage vB_RspM_Barba19A]|jgi:hypothetical protein|uniref:Uncharacterized protein n=2 Tax=Barbavirus barba19A TaxID=2734091 RepID=A0A4V1EZZ7_9CAUD|nr:hypothetical protein HOV47_gp095 [Rheinheimera phage vB_RspM_Barba19A]QCQ61935.1 hypothetical protein Barba19A_gp095 [Rheinheimera phage vB_RspM_Barba19A]QCQ64685.1 hypothetical protein Barba31A_gp095 [Rheinheimera phage vB_RspM_Barba31A]